MWESTVGITKNRTDTIPSGCLIITQGRSEYWIYCKTPLGRGTPPPPHTHTHPAIAQSIAFHSALYDDANGTASLLRDYHY